MAMVNELNPTVLRSKIQFPGAAKFPSVKTEVDSSILTAIHTVCDRLTKTTGSLSFDFVVTKVVLYLLEEQNWEYSGEEDLQFSVEVILRDVMAQCRYYVE